MYCKKCGAEIEDNAVYCPECGVKIRDNKRCLKLRTVMNRKSQE